MRKAERQQKQGVSRQASRFKNSVAELKERMDRVDSALDKELTEVCKSRTVDTVVGSSSEVYRDKNTLVEVTIHRRPKGETGVKRVEGRNSAPEAGRLESRTKKGAASGGGSFLERKRERNVGELLDELRELVADSGVNEVRKFLEELDGVGKPASGRKVASCQVENHRNLEGQLTKLHAELEKQRAETSRYKHEHSVVSKQADLRRVDQENLEAQLVDLKKIVSRLTKNNSELLSIVAEKINYEEKIGGLEARAAQLAQQVESERARAEETNQRLAISQREGAALRAVAADLRAGLQHGLAGLDSARPGSALSRQGNKTRDILGASVLQASNCVPATQAQEDSEDSAIDDPNSESLKSSRRAQMAVHLPLNAETGKDRWAGLTHTPPTKQRSQATHPASSGIAPAAFGVNVPLANAGNPLTEKPGSQLLADSFKDSASNLMPPPQSSQFRVEVLQPSRGQINHRSQVPGKASGPNNYDEQSGWVNPEIVPLHRATSAPPPSRPAVPFPPLAQQFTAPAHLMTTQLDKGENLLPMELARAGSRSSTLLLSSNHPQDFQPAALELSETRSITETDGDASKDLTRDKVGHSKEFEKLSQGQSGPTSKGSLENKVADFLQRLHQDSINLSLDLPCAREFAGPSMHLSISGSDLGEGELTTNTTLTEGKFLRGLETSIEVLNQAESSHSDMG